MDKLKNVFIFFLTFVKICVSASKRSIKLKKFIPKNTKKILFQNNYSVKIRRSLPELVVLKIKEKGYIFTYRD